MHTTSLPETSDNFTAIHTPFVSTDSARPLADGSIRQVELLESRWFTGILTYGSRGCFSSWTFVSHSKPKWLPVCYDDAMSNVKATNQRYSNTVTVCIESTNCSDINVGDESNLSANSRREAKFTRGRHVDPKQNIEATDMDDWIWAILGCCFFPTLFVLVTHCQKLTSAKRRNTAVIYAISIRIVSAIQAVLASCVGVAIATSCQDVLHDKHWLTEPYAWFMTPYFYYDIAVMYRGYWHKNRRIHEMSTSTAVLQFVKDSPLLTFHHTIFPLVYLPVVVWWRKGLGDFFVGCFYLIELAVPFISMRAVLIQHVKGGYVSGYVYVYVYGYEYGYVYGYGYVYKYVYGKVVDYLHKEDTVAYVLNGAALFVTFTLGRVAIFPYLYWVYGRYIGVPAYRVPFHIPVKCTAGCAGVLVVQLYWWLLIARTSARTIGKLSRKWRNVSDVNKVEKEKIS
ncbi:Ceramide synthase [Lamellibrachia satsuma]|nr:Ceramide synthase [Lamellibrachia satsuma]